MATNAAMTEVPNLTRVASASKWRPLRVWGARTLAALALLGLLGVGVVGWGISTSPGARRAVDAYGFGTSPGRRAVDGSERVQVARPSSTRRWSTAGPFVVERRPPRHERNIVSETNGILDAVRELAPHIASRGDEIEQGRRVPPDLVEELTEAGCFRMLVPRSHGGAELDLPAQMRVIDELARADGSVGWTVMIGRGGAGDPRAAARARPSTTCTPTVPTSSSPARSTRRAWPRRSTAGTASPDSGRSPAAASTATGSSPTASWTTAASRRYA